MNWSIASTEPRLVGRGVGVRCALLRFARDASTEPRLVGRGVALALAVLPLLARSFNGAAPCWARSALVLASSPPRSSSFNGAAPCWARSAKEEMERAREIFKLQRSRALLGAECQLRVESVPRAGPASTEPRLVGRGVRRCSHESRRRLLASTEPRLVGRGVSVITEPGNNRITGFNGAAPCWARSGNPNTQPTSGKHLLQRSRALLGAECRSANAHVCGVAALQRSRALLGAE